MNDKRPSFLKNVVFALGIATTIALSLTGLIVVPNWQFQALQPVVKADGTQYPVPYTGDTLKGRQVYISQGCIYCHTQQIRMRGYGADIRRNWGSRRSVPRDYLFEKPHQLGTQRMGPDLASVGSRQPSVEWHALHLYNPQITSRGSIMPRYNYLFDEIRGGTAASEAIKIPTTLQSDGVTHILPTERGRHLINYLKSLNKTFPLPEAQQ